ncbi:MAG: class I SAM-dependent methyltransferase [Chloroflexi bacterium]|nr:class I SAM-dependent methyltransferase [Chloroflexota bacterium]
MNHDDHVALLKDGIAAPGGVWADFGAGSGAFTLALAELIGVQGSIYAVDRDPHALDEQARRLRQRFPALHVQHMAADFTQPLDLPPLDGIVMANALHFVRAKNPLLQRLRAYLKPGGRLLLVEYNVDTGNRWVPYPLSYSTWQEIAQHNGFAETRKLAARPSRFLGEIYSALSFNPAR